MEELNWDKGQIGRAVCIKTGNMLHINVNMHIKNSLGLEPGDIVAVKYLKTGEKHKRSKKDTRAFPKKDPFTPRVKKEEIEGVEENVEQRDEQPADESLSGDVEPDPEVEVNEPAGPSVL